MMGFSGHVRTLSDQCHIRFTDREFRKGDGCSLAGFLKSAGKILATDSNDSLQSVDYDAKGIFVRRFTNWS